MNYVELFTVSWRFEIHFFLLYSFSPGSYFCFLLNSSTYMMQSKKEDSMHEVLCQMLDGKQDISTSDSKIWFALEHPKVSLLDNFI